MYCTARGFPRSGSAGAATIAGLTDAKKKKFYIKLNFCIILPFLKELYDSPHRRKH